MCRAISCKICGKTTWAGCGQHVNQVMKDVPRADRCPGHTAEERTAAKPANPLARLFGRG